MSSIKCILLSPCTRISRIIFSSLVKGAVRRTLVWFPYFQTNILDLVAVVALYFDNLCLDVSLFLKIGTIRFLPKVMDRARRMAKWNPSSKNPGDAPEIILFYNNKWVAARQMQASKTYIFSYSKFENEKYGYISWNVLKIHF